MVGIFAGPDKDNILGVQNEAVAAVEVVPTDGRHFSHHGGPTAFDPKQSWREGVSHLLESRRNSTPHKSVYYDIIYLETDLNLKKCQSHVPHSFWEIRLELRCFLALDFSVLDRSSTQEVIQLNSLIGCNSGLILRSLQTQPKVQVHLGRSLYRRRLQSKTCV